MSNPFQLHRCPRVSRDSKTRSLVPEGEIITCYTPWNGEILYEWQLIQMGFPIETITNWKISSTNQTRFIEIGWCELPTPEQLTPELLADLEARDRQAKERENAHAPVQ